MLLYHPTLDILEFTKDKGADYVLKSKSKGLYTSQLKSFFNVFLHNMKLCGYRIGTKIEKSL